MMNAFRPKERNVDVLIGGQWGSEGKGNIVSRIASRYDVLVRTGGPNAGHQVKYEGQVFTFHHLPSGCLHNNTAPIVLGPGAVINPDTLLHEIEKARIPKGRVYIDPQATVIFEEDIQMEKEYFEHLGSTAQGVGFATVRKIMRMAPGRRSAIARDCKKLELFLRKSEELTANHKLRILVEGTQGTMLSLHHGNWPYVTSRDTSASGFLSEAGIPPTRVNRVIMVVRSYPIRVQSPLNGTSGPMGEELDWEDVAKESGISASILREKEKTSTTKRQRRVARFNPSYFIRAVQLNGPTDLALTFADYLGDDNRITEFSDMLQRISGVPVTLISRGFGPEHVWIHPQWDVAT